MITKDEAIKITNESVALQSNNRQARLELFLKDAETNIRDAAKHGRNRAVWSVGTNEFVEDILRTLRAQGFTVSYSVFSFTVEW